MGTSTKVVAIGLLFSLAACGDGGPTGAAATKDSAAAATAASPSSASTAAVSASPAASVAAPTPTPVENATSPSSSAPQAAPSAPSAPKGGPAEAHGKTAASPSATPAASAAPEAPKGPVAGKPWQVVASADADAGYHCNGDYPNKFTTTGGTNVTYPDPKPRGACAGNRVVVNVPIVPTAAGPGTVVGTLSYGICDDSKTSCLMKKKEMTLSFVASP